MEKEQKIDLDRKVIGVLECKSIEVDTSEGKLPVDCYYENKINEDQADICFGYKSNRNSLRLFQITCPKPNKTYAQEALLSINFEDEELLKDLVYTGVQIIKEEPLEVKNQKDMSAEISINEYFLLMIHQSPRIKLVGTTLFENYAKRVIQRNTK